MKTREERMDEWAIDQRLAPSDTLAIVIEGIKNGTLEFIAKQQGYLAYRIFAGYGNLYAVVMAGNSVMSAEIITSNDVELYINLDEL